MTRYKKVLEEIKELKRRMYGAENPFKYDIGNVVYFKYYVDEKTVNTKGIIIDRDIQSIVFFSTTPSYRLVYEILSEKEKYEVIPNNIIKRIRKNISIK